MRVPVKYIENIKKGVIDDAMLEDCLVAVNKRAKNCRNALRHLPTDSPKHHQAVKEKQSAKLRRYYSMKYDFLNLLEPVVLHRESYEDKHIKVMMSWLQNYDDLGQRAKRNEFEDGRIEYYYLFYQMKNHSFHKPITKEEFEQYQEKLQVVKLPTNIVTDGLDEEDMLSMEFVNQVYDSLMQGKLTYQRNRESNLSFFILRIFCTYDKAH